MRGGVQLRVSWWGEFAFGIWDAERREVYLARDPPRVRRLFVSRSAEPLSSPRRWRHFASCRGSRTQPTLGLMACHIADLATGPDGPLALRDAVRVQAGSPGLPRRNVGLMNTALLRPARRCAGGLQATPLGGRTTEANRRPPGCSGRDRRVCSGWRLRRPGPQRSSLWWF